MRQICWLFIWLLFALADSMAQATVEDYITEWTDFHPSKAVRMGIRSAIFKYEDRTQQSIDGWVRYNKEVLRHIEDGDFQIDPIDEALLKARATRERDTYGPSGRTLTHIRYYLEFLKAALPSMETAPYLLAHEREGLLPERILAMARLCAAARAGAQSISKGDLETTLMELDDLTQQVAAKIAAYSNKSRDSAYRNHLKDRGDLLKREMNLLRNMVVKLPEDERGDTVIMGSRRYNEELAAYTHSALDAPRLAQMALEEMGAVKKEMAAVAAVYLKKQYPQIPLSEDSVNITRALADIEKDIPKSAEDYLLFWQGLAQAAKDFIADKNIASLPSTNTLKIRTAPESAGAAARIGWVAAAAPFAPNPQTVLYLPSIPDTLSASEQKDFWTSFNKPFNRMIVIHELYPGHYMQMKIARESPHPLRLLFPYEPYIEGWATFTEAVLLDAGWEADRPLTRLAHLRKRLENANRAYTSVQVHCNGWSEEDVMDFSIRKALVAPQFAKSLWGRILRSPMQLTSYFWGGAQFKALLEHERNRLGARFDLKVFMDTIMRSGPIPIDTFYTIFDPSEAR